MGTVTGYADRSFNGTVKRINPTADPMTRQVKVFIEIPNSAGTLLGDLFARDHQAGMGVGLHAVRGLGVEKGLGDLLRRAADVEVNGLGGLEEAVQVLGEEGPVAVVEAQALPDAVPDQVARVEDGGEVLRPAQASPRRASTTLSR